MRIGIGAIVGILGGPATYARELIRALVRCDTANEYVVITDAPELVEVSAANVRCVRAPLPASLLQPLWDHGFVPFLIRKYDLDLYHGTKGALPFLRSAREVVTIHDLSVYHQPETFAWLQRIHQRSHTALAVQRAVRVITVSEHTRQDLLQRFALSADQVVAIPLAAAPCFSPAGSSDDHAVLKRLQVPAEYLLYAGTIQPRKNVDMLVEAVGELADRGGVQLLIAGRVRPGYQPAFLRRCPAHVRYLGAVTDDVLSVLYRHAIALCSPSSYEGFGLSLLEAMASGCLVVAGRNSAVPEVVDDCGVLLDELTVAALRSALEKILHASRSFDDMRARARARAALFSWDETARRTLAVYREVMDGIRAAA
jgi:glycosyltransferase involved in cell wall biosynthesis